MNKSLTLLIVLILCSGLVFAVPGDWWGTVSINGNMSTDGVTVFGLVNGAVKDQSIVGEYTAGYYLLHLEGSPSNPITFRVYDMPATQTATWSAGNHLQLDLTVATLANGLACTYYQSCASRICCSGTCASSCSTPSGGGSGGGHGGYTVYLNNTKPSCIPDWTCGMWGNCSVDGMMFRKCTDNNVCNSVKNKPWTNSTCVYFPDEKRNITINNLDEQIAKADDRLDIQRILKTALESEGLTNIGTIEKEVLFSKMLEVKRQDLKDFEKTAPFTYSSKYEPISITETATAYRMGENYVTVFSLIIDESNVSTSFSVIESVPKEIAMTSADLIFYDNPQILKSDPVIKWTFNPTTDLRFSYGVKGKAIMESAVINPTTITYYEKTTTDWKTYFDFINFQGMKDYVSANKEKITGISILLGIIISSLSIYSMIRPRRKRKRDRLNYEKILPVPEDLMPLYDYVMRNLRRMSQDNIIDKAGNNGWSDEDIVRVFDAIKN